MGLSYQETHDLPMGELLDLIAVEQIYHGSVKQKAEEDDEDIIPNVR